MKKVMLVLLCVMAMAVFASAQAYVPTQDVLGAHNNGGRGCAGCHAPHSGQGGSGGNKITGQTSDTTHSGDDFLFAQDLGPIYGMTLRMGDGGRFVETLPTSANFAVGDEEIRGIAACLACHDGAVARGAMMVGTSYEKRMGMLPAGVYGPNDIPTLLGADGYGTGYNNDHPVGVQATLGAAHLTSSNMTITLDSTGTSISSIAPVAGSQYASFVSDYGMPAIAGTPWGYGVAVNPAITVGAQKDPACVPSPGPPAVTCATYSVFDKTYLTCTTCHNQHVMNVYKVPYNKGSLMSAGGTYKTYFFINGPYNVDNLNQGGNTLTNQAASATQFCRQCHFSVSNEAFGLNLPTKF